MIELKPATAPAYLKAGFFGATGTGKTYTVSKLLAQFQKLYVPDATIAMFDTEPSAGYVAPMMKKITGKDLLVHVSRSFSDLMEFTRLCIDKKYIMYVDSITHPWRQLCKDYLDTKKSRVKAANGNPETVRLSLKDWGPLKDIWGEFSELFAYAPIHAVILGREGDVWEDVQDEEGKSEMKKTGVKMKTESELGYEPSLLVNMQLLGDQRLAYVAKDRFDMLTGQTSKDRPDIEFFKPHLDCLAIGGKPTVKAEDVKIFGKESGPNYETLKAQREALLENIKDDITLKFPGRTAEENKGKIEAIRAAFSGAAWPEIESDWKKWPIDKLQQGREKLTAHLLNVKETANGKNGK